MTLDDLKSLVRQGREALDGMAYVGVLIEGQVGPVWASTLGVDESPDFLVIGLRSEKGFYRVHPSRVIGMKIVLSEADKDA